MKEVGRFLPLQARVGGALLRRLPVFSRVEELPRKDETGSHLNPGGAPVLYGVGDNTGAAQLRAVLRGGEGDDGHHPQSAFALFSGTYTNFLTLYSALSRGYERRAAHVGSLLKQQYRNRPSPEDWGTMYLAHRRMLQERTQAMDRLLLAVNKQGTECLGLKGSPRQASNSPLARVVTCALEQALADKPDETYDGVLLGSLTFTVLKSAAQYEIKGVSIAGLGRIRVRYNVFPPTRKDYIELFNRAFDVNSVHRIEPSTMRRCLDIGTGTGVLSLLIHAHGARHVTGVDINDDAILNATENRTLLAMNSDSVEFRKADLFPDASGSIKYDLIVCNPPWIPLAGEDVPAAQIGLMNGVLDKGGNMLTSILQRLRHHLAPQGRFWLIYSNMAVQLGFQDEGWLATLCSLYGLRIRAQTSMPSQVRLHPQDPFYELKKNELITLYDITHD